MVSIISLGQLQEENKVTTNKIAEQVQQAITAELMIGFWLGVGVMLEVGVADGFNHFVRAVTRGK